MRTVGLLERLKDLIAGTDGAVAQSGPRDTNGAGPIGHARDVGQIIQRLEEQDATSVMAGCLQLLWLHTVKERLGPQWSELADRVLKIAQDTLDQLLSPEDVYRLVDDSSFQICFASGDEARAQSRVAEISAEIEGRIFAELKGTERELSVDSFVAAVPFATIRDAEDPLSALYCSLLGIRNAVASSSLKGHDSRALRFSKVLYQPLWCNRDFGHTKNRCLLDTLSGGAAADRLQEIDQLDDLVAAIAHLDAVMFAKSIEGLHQALQEATRATIVIPVHFQTLLLWPPDFRQITATLPLPYKRLVILDLIGIPLGASRGEILKALGAGRTITDRIVVQMSPTDHRMNPAMRNLIWGASVNLNDLDHRDSLVTKDLVRFAIASSELGIYSLAYGANTIGKANIAMEAGFDHIGGSAVASTGPIPRPQTRLVPIFRDAGAKIKGERKAALRDHPRFAPLNPKATLTLPSGERYDCRIPNASASGAVVLCNVTVVVGDYLVVGSIPSQVVRIRKGGFAVHFLEVHHPSAVEVALQTPIQDDEILSNLRLLKT